MTVSIIAGYRGHKISCVCNHLSDQKLILCELEKIMRPDFVPWPLFTFSAGNIFSLCSSSPVYWKVKGLNFKIYGRTWSSHASWNCKKSRKHELCSGHMHSSLHLVFKMPPTKSGLHCNRTDVVDGPVTISQRKLTVVLFSDFFTAGLSWEVSCLAGHLRRAWSTCFRSLLFLYCFADVCTILFFFFFFLFSLPVVLRLQSQVNA